MVNCEEFEGKVYGRLTAVKPLDLNLIKSGKWLFHCTCGNEYVARLPDARKGKLTSCGCRRKEGLKPKTHGLTKSAEYNIWQGIKTRTSPRSKNKTIKKYYTSKGIGLCDAWNSFEAFYADMGPRPSALHSIDRIDNALGYSKENCRWATHSQQMRNTERKTYLFRGKKYKLHEIIETHGNGMKFATFLARIKRGWSVEDAILKGVRCLSIQIKKENAVKGTGLSG